MLKFDPDLSLADLPPDVYQDLVTSLNKDGNWKILADHVFKPLNYNSICPICTIPVSDSGYSCAGCFRLCHKSCTVKNVSDIEGVYSCCGKDSAATMDESNCESTSNEPAPANTCTSPTSEHVPSTIPELFHFFQNEFKNINKEITSLKDRLAVIEARSLPTSSDAPERLQKRSLEDLYPKNVFQGEILLKELPTKMCTVGIFSTLLEQCNLVNTLSVLQSPELVTIITPPIDAEVYLGCQLHLKCAALGIPPPKYEWYHENNKLDGQTSHELILQLTSISQEGAYRCKVSQIDHKGRLLHEIFSIPASVTIMPSPVVIEKEPNPYITVKEGDRLLLNCDATGHPYPQFQWYRGNILLDGEVNKMLRIERFTSNEEGKYHCHVRNKISEKSTQESLVTLDLPRQKAVAKVGLLIANETYYFQNLLKTPKNDVATVAKILKGLGFVTICLADLTLTQMNNAIKIFSDALIEGTYGLFYFAGHGFKMNENYMLPIDAPESYLRKDAVCENVLLSMTLKNDPALMVVILDMCQIAPKIEWNPKIHEEIPSINEYKGQNNLRNLLQAYSTSSYRPSYENINRNCGLYVTHLCKYLGEIIPVTKVFEEVGKSLDRYLKGKEREQIPMFATAITKPFRLTDAFSTDSPPQPITSIEKMMTFQKRAVEIHFPKTGFKCKLKVSQYMEPFLNSVQISLIELDDKYEAKFSIVDHLKQNNLYECNIKNKCWIHNPQVTEGKLNIDLQENGTDVDGGQLDISTLIPAILEKLN